MHQATAMLDLPAFPIGTGFGEAATVADGFMVVLAIERHCRERMAIIVGELTRIAKRVTHVFLLDVPMRYVFRERLIVLLIIRDARSRSNLHLGI